MADWTCPRCGRAFAARNARHSCTSQSPDTFFASYPKALPIYHAVQKFLLGLPRVAVEATKTQVAFRADRRFAFLWIPAMALGRGAPDLYLTFDLTRPLRSSRVKEVVESHPNVWTHHVLLASKGTVDAEVKAWLKRAYEDRGLKGEKATPRSGSSA